MKKAIVFCMVVLVLASLAFAQGSAKDDEKATAKPTVTSAATEKNQTFGQCVSKGAAIKNTCYGTAKDARAACEDAEASSEDKKTATAACRNDYKKAMKQCKMDFKAAKKECAKIKHNMMDSMKAAFA